MSPRASSSASRTESSMALQQTCPSKIIHCILPAGSANDLVERLRQEHGLACVISHHARGGGISTKKGEKAFRYIECDVVTLLAPAARADELFEFVYRAAGIDQRHTGMVLMESCLIAGTTIADIEAATPNPENKTDGAGET